MDSIGKIVEEMRSREDEYDYGTLSSFVAEWADRIEALTKEPVGEITSDGFSMLYGHKPLAPRTKLFAATPAPAMPDDVIRELKWAVENSNCGPRTMALLLRIHELLATEPKEQT